jgi:hypothetical protein
MDNPIIRDNALVIEGREYLSAAFGVMLDALGAGEITITSAAMQADADGGKNFAVTGAAQILSQPVAVELYLDFLEGDAFEFQLTSTFQDLSFSTLRDKAVLPDSPFVAQLLPMSFPGVKLTFDSEKTELYFGAIESDARLEIFQGLSLDSLGFEFLRSYTEKTALLVVYATILIGNTSIETKIEIPLGGALSPKCWALTSRSTIPFGSGLNDIIHFLGNAFGVSFDNVFPEALNSISTFFLDDLQILLDPAAGKIQFLTFRIRSLSAIEIGGQLSISKVGLRVNITPAPARPGISLTLFGSIKIKEGVSLDVQVMLPENLSQDNWIFFMSGGIALNGLVDIDGLPINTPVNDLHLHPGFLNLNSLELKVLEVDFNPLTAALPKVVFDLVAYAECELIHDLKLKNPRLSFTAMNPFNQSEPGNRSLTGSIAGTIAVGDINFGVLAEKRDRGWSFTGATETKSILVGEMISSIGQKFGVTTPDFINGIELENLTLRFETSADDQDNNSRRATFDCQGNFPVDDGKAKTSLAIDVKRDVDYTIDLSGELTISSLIFKTTYSQNATDNFFAAVYSHTKEQKSIKLKELIGSFSSRAAAYTPENLEVDLKYVLLAFEKGNDGNKFLFGMDLGASAGLSDLVSNLPLIGKMLPPDQTIGIDDLQILIASKPFDQTLGARLSDILPGESVNDAGRAMLRKGPGIGINVSATMRFGDVRLPLDLPISGGNSPNPATPEPGASATTPNVTSSDNAKWFALQKAFGPVSFNRVGLQYKESELHVLLDASITIAGLRLSLDGLSVSSPLSKFEPKFNLRGLGIDYSNGPVEIGGAFLKTQVQVGGKTYDEYDGAAIIKATQFTLSAIGSYADLDGHPSLFIYAVLDYPLGGPAFFFVTGLAAGFGYNRSLLMPTIDQVAQFPLVAQAVNGQRTPNNLTTQLQSLQRYIPPAVGETFLAVGIKFTSFKIIDSFVLLTVAFGTRFEVNLLGLSTLISPPQAPPNVPPLAVVQMAVRAAFIPDEGFLGVQAQLTPASYIFTRDCHLTGGFAFYSWFSGAHAGEFVITLGGYHPNFNVPDYYPKVPRLGLSWQVNSNLSVKGGIYYALTASTLMAGGSLQATWQDGNLNAWFNAAADFIVSWKPYHYDAYIRVNMGVSYTFTVDLWVTTVRKTISVDVGADLHIWGPEFSGRAHIKLNVVSFDVTFGNASSQQPQPISWVDFRNSFLPRDEEVCGIAIRNGLTQTTEAKQWVVNPKDFCLMTDSMIPSKTALAGDRQLQFSDPVETDFGVGPMAVAPNNLITKHKIQINRIVGGEVESAEDDFDFVPVKKRAPAGLWGKSLTPSVNGQGYIEQALSGFEIRPKNPPAPGMTSDIDIGALQYDPTNVQNAFYWETFKSFNVSPETDDARRARIRSGLMQAETIEARNRLLQDLGLSSNLTLSESTADAFSVPPQVGSFVS